MSYNYPPGAEYSSFAPWNSSEIPLKEVEFTVSQTLHKDVTVLTDSYIPDEEGHIQEFEKSFEEIYKEEHLELTQAFEKSKKLCEEIITSPIVSERIKGLAKELNRELQGWILDEFEAIRL